MTNKIINVYHDEENLIVIKAYDGVSENLQRISLNECEALFVMENLVKFMQKQINKEKL